MIKSSFHLEEGGNLTPRLKLKKPRERDKTLFLVMCSACNRIRGKNDNWISINKTIIDNENVRISHGICPECRKVLYPGL